MPALPQSSVISSALLPSHPHPTTKDQSWRWDGDEMEAALRVGWAGRQKRWNAGALCQGAKLCSTCPALVGSWQGGWWGSCPAGSPP